MGRLTAPPTTGGTANVFFSFTNNLNPQLDQSYAINSLTFDSLAVGYIVGRTTGNTTATLSLDSGGISHQSPGTNTLVVPANLTASQTFLVSNANGTLQVSAPLSFNQSNTALTLTIDGAGTTNLAGGINEASGTGGLTKLGGGTLTLTGNNTYQGTTNVNGGTLAVTSGSLSTGAINIGITAGAQLNTGAFIQTGGNISTKGALDIGDGFIIAGGGTRLTSIGTYTLSGSGSSLSTGGVTIGNNGGTGTFTQSAGSFTANGNGLLLGYYAGSGTYNLQGGSLSTGYVVVGGGTNGNATGVFTQSGGTLKTGEVRLGTYSAGATGTYILSGGMLTTTDVAKGDSTGIFHFNRGTLQAAASDSPAATSNPRTFMAGLTKADVQAGGAKIDTQSFNVTVAQSLASGVSGGLDGGLTKGGAGMLTLTGNNTYTGATTVFAGTLVAASNMALGTGNVEVASGARLTLNAGVVLAGMQGSTLTLDSALNSTVNLLGTGVQDTVGALVIAGVNQLPGTYGALGSGATFVLPDFTGTGELLVQAVPEPSTWAMLVAGVGLMGSVTLRQHRRAQLA